VSRPTGHVSSDRLGEAARHASLDFLRDAERLHVESCERCRRLYGGYRLTDRLLAAPWREVKLPAVELERPTRGAILADRLGGFAAGFEPRTLAPITAIAAIVLLVGAAVALPRLIPAPAAGTASPSRTPSMAGGTQAWPSTSSQATPVPQATGSGKAPSKPPEPTPAITPTPASAALALNPARLSGDPLAWSPNGDHLLMWVSGRIQIRDASGRLEGGVAADAAAWYSPSLVAVVTRSSGWRSPGTETVKLVDAAGHVAAALPGIYDIGGSSFAALLGSGSG
jgi:hypothetical protein